MLLISNNMQKFVSLIYWSHAVYETGASPKSFASHKKNKNKNKNCINDDEPAWWWKLERDSDKIMFLLPINVVCSADIFIHLCRLIYLCERDILFFYYFIIFFIYSWLELLHFVIIVSIYIMMINSVLHWKWEANWSQLNCNDIYI